MKFTQKLLDRSFASSAAYGMKLICYGLMVLLSLCLILGCMGRQTFFLHTQEGSYSSAIYGKENHDVDSRGMTVNMGDDVHVWTDSQNELPLSLHLGLSVVFAVHTLPALLGYWFLSRIFSNVHAGQIFVENNARYLLYYGLIQCISGLFVPWLKLLLCHLTSLLSGCRVTISTGQQMLAQLIPGIAFLVAAYIIHYGVHLQDEVDHTL